MTPDRIAPQLTDDGLAVRLPLRRGADTLLDDLALAYATKRDNLARLLAAHAANVTALDLAICDDDATDTDRAVRAADAAGTREALLGELANGHHLEAELTVPAAIALADDLTATAARVHLAQNGHRA